MAMTPRGFGDTHELRHPVRSRSAAMAKRDLAKDHKRTQRPLGKVVRRWDAIVIDKDQPLGEVAVDPALKRQRLFMRHLDASQDASDAHATRNLRLAVVAR